jgi:hypothetical protein
VEWANLMGFLLLAYFHVYRSGSWNIQHGLSNGFGFTFKVSYNLRGFGGLTIQSKSWSSGR